MLLYLSNGVKLIEERVGNGIRDFWDAILNRVVWEDFTDKITGDQKPEKNNQAG